MFLVRLIYASEVSGTFGSNDIEQILVSAREKNPLQSITGMLCFNQNYFLQCVEGSRSAVNTLLRNLMNDDRHINVVILDYSELSERAFSNWSMGFVPESKLTAKIKLKYGINKEFSPYKMSGGSAFKMLLELSSLF